MAAPDSKCFDPYTANGTTINCGTDSFGVPIAECSGATRADAHGVACRRACSLTQYAADCLAKSKAYCADNQSNADCKCLFPKNTEVSLSAQTLAYNDLDSFAKAQDFGFDTRCIWHACSSSRGATILQDYELRQSCPNNPVFCSVSNVTITIDNLQAGNINPVAQNCGKTSGSKGSQASQGGGPNKSPSLTKMLPYAIGGAAAVIIIGFVVVLLAWHHARVRDATSQMMHTANVLLSKDAKRTKPADAKAAKKTK